MAEQDDVQMQPGGQPEASTYPGKIGRFLWIIAGSFFLGLGIIGIAVPLLPTTPFLLLAAACYSKGSKRLHNWLLTNKVFGEYLKDYHEKRGLPIRVKIMTISLLWITIMITAFIILDNLIIRIILLVIAVGVTTHIVTIKTKKRDVPAD